MATQTGKRLDGVIYPRNTSNWAESSSGTQDREEEFVSYTTETIEKIPRQKPRPLEILAGIFIGFLDTLIFVIQVKVIPVVSWILSFPFKFLRSWLFQSFLLMFFAPFAIGKRLALSLGLIKWIIGALQMEEIQTQNSDRVQELNNMRIALDEMSNNLAKVSAERDLLLRDRNQKNQLEKEKDILQKKLNDFESGWKTVSSDLARAKEDLKTQAKLVKENDILGKKLKDMEEGWRLVSSDLAAAKDKLQKQEALLAEQNQLESRNSVDLTQLETRMREENERNISVLRDQHRFELENSGTVIREELSLQFEQQIGELRASSDRSEEEKLRLEEELDALRSSLAEDQNTSKARQIRDLKAHVKQLQNQLESQNVEREIEIIK